MINEEKTLAEFGYKSSDWGINSSKLIYVNCDYCGSEKLLKKQSLTESLKTLNKYACIKCKPIKTKESNLIKYGKTCNLHTDEGKSKTKNTMLVRYGVEHALQSKEIKKKQNETIFERFGVDNALKNIEVQEKYKKTIVEKYGVDNIAKNEKVKEKTRESRIQSGNIKIFDGQCMESWAKKLKLAYSSFMERVNKWGLERAVKKNKLASSLELKFIDYFKENNIRYKQHKKIDDKICDFWLNDYNIIIECDGLFWHCDQIIKDKEYHRKKYKLYKNLGYIPLFFREDEILNKFDIVISILNNKIKSNNKIYARECQVKEVDYKDACDFFEQNHLMGRGQGVAFGLYFNDILCGILQVRDKGGGKYDISRFCCKLNISIVGGFSRLLSHFEKTFSPKELTNFIDRRYGNGGYLEKLGFVKSKTTLSFRWCKKGKTVHRMKFPSNSGYDQGWAKIWDCGQAKYVKIYPKFEEKTQNGV